MITVEHPYDGHTDWIRHVSDAGKMIRQNETGNLYSEAVDVYPTNFTYTETTEGIEEKEEPDLWSEVEDETTTPDESGETDL